mmetsp:Transcript_56520/g.175326  ORF Transcript_56520/g.175326 Transcript_56520/m.175326 type:complete len:320 (+) Transcript_56520:54-1013(+)
MASIADAQDLQVRSLSGELWLSLPRQELAFEGLRVVDLKRRLHEEAHGYASELQLIVGQRALEDEDLLEASWPEEGGMLVIHLLGGILPRDRRLEMERTVHLVFDSLLLQGEEALSAALERIADLELRTHLELAVIARAILSRALLETDHCEIIAAAAAALSERCPRFLSDVGGRQQITFQRVLLDTVQCEFESLLAAEEPAEGLAEASTTDLQQRSSRIHATVRFIGHLLLRRLFPVSGVGLVEEALNSTGGGRPKEHLVTCSCSLLEIVGWRLRASEPGRRVMRQFCTRWKGRRRQSGLSVALRLRIRRLSEMLSGL